MCGAPRILRCAGEVRRAHDEHADGARAGRAVTPCRASRGRFPRGGAGGDHLRRVRRRCRSRHLRPHPATGRGLAAAGGPLCGGAAVRGGRCAGGPLCGGPLCGGPLCGGAAVRGAAVRGAAVRGGPLCGGDRCAGGTAVRGGPLCGGTAALGNRDCPRRRSDRYRGAPGGPQCQPCPPTAWPHTGCRRCPDGSALNSFSGETTSDRPGPGQSAQAERIRNGR